MKFTELPDTVLAAILSAYCDGKTISTLTLSVISGGRFWNVCRNVLVERLVCLRQALNSHEEICVVLDITREDIRRSTNDEDDEIVKKFSYWCAILDYFETQLHLNQHRRPTRDPQWVVWCGAMTIPLGSFQGFLTTPFWTLGAMTFWKSIEMENASFCRPSQNFHFHQPHSDEQTSDGYAGQRIPYGTIFAIDPVSKRRLTFQCADLAVHGPLGTNHWRHALIPLSQYYDEDPSIVLVEYSLISRMFTSQPVGPLIVGQSSLCVCWDKDNGDDDWEFSFDRLGERCVEIMKAFPGKTFGDGLLASDCAYATDFEDTSYPFRDSDTTR